MRLKVLAPAQADVGEAVEFYGKISLDLGRAFLGEIKRGYAQLRREPLIGSPVEHHERKYVLKRYPYNLIYRIEESTIFILAVAHHRRKPGYWREEP
ncbi:type II toxin-antitoxin system RelE/ParE family toxin [Longimicrobium sp.]|uniref:type II toxin-antitoxin system RelE/ParE family toxin n=1 Tax=Longimicrobium sp. TaxID=2029185 RepID=UPI002E3407FE|nr:type II toxin-antitoxin system RelE/ParE family toxin [Longimicrobium sp.]HEX6036608.1 type II toxin-antitoxin system RelE/ParE family toxin [Longimicrobium sp.]